MPLLPLEPFIYPDDLLSPEKSGESASQPWWALHTKPRTEKALARSYHARSVPFFLPLSKHQWRNRGRLHCSFMPLFPGYIFVQGDRESILPGLQARQVARVLPVDDQGRLQADLARVYSLIATGSPLTAEERLVPGSLVEIIAGPFAGLEGKVLRRGKQLKLFVEVQFIQRGVSVEIENWMIEPRSESKLAVAEHAR